MGNYQFKTDFDTENITGKLLLHTASCYCLSKSLLDIQYKQHYQPHICISVLYYNNTKFIVFCVCSRIESKLHLQLLHRQGRLR